MFEEILKKIKPSKEEEKIIWNKINEFLEILEDAGLETMVGGSIGKGTWLRGVSDVDVYVLFENDEEISDKLENTLKELNFNYIRVHGSRDYFKVPFHDLEFELVPILKISNPKEAKNVTDISPFHIKYVKSKISEDPKLADEIRLTKAFAKAINAYGAESYVNGFSGYACEVLTIYYGSFMNLLKAASNWRPKVIIDPEKAFKNLQEIFKKLDKHKLKSPIVVIDPVYPERNITSAVRGKAFASFIFYSRRLLEDINNAEKYFEKKTINLSKAVEKSKKLGVKLIYLIVKGQSNNLDVANTKVLKFAELISKNLKSLGFVVEDIDIVFQKNLNSLAEIFVYYYPESLPEYEKKMGPPVWVRENSENFYERWKDSEIKFDDSGRIIVFGKRKVRTSREAIEYILDKYKEAVEDKVSIYKIDFF